MSYVSYTCFFAYGGVQHIMCCVVFCFSSTCVPYVASSFGLSIFDNPFGSLYSLFNRTNIIQMTSSVSRRLDIVCIMFKVTRAFLITTLFVW